MARIYTVVGFEESADPHLPLSARVVISVFCYFLHGSAWLDVRRGGLVRRGILPGRRRGGLSLTLYKNKQICFTVLNVC